MRAARTCAGDLCTPVPPLPLVKTYVTENIPKPGEKILQNRAAQLEPRDRESGRRGGQNKRGGKGSPILQGLLAFPNPAHVSPCQAKLNRTDENSKLTTLHIVSSCSSEGRS